MHRLSRRECETLILALQGLTDKETAKRLNVSTGSVRTYWERMRKKYGASNRLEIVGKLLSNHMNTDLLTLLEQRASEAD